MRRSLILDRGAETMTVYPTITVVDARRNEREQPDMSNPIRVRVTAVTDRQSVAELDGQVEVKILKIMARYLPVTTWARCEFRGELWDLAIPPTINRTSRALSHYEIVIRSRNEKVE